MERQRDGLWALADQGVVSLGAFLCNILLARKMAHEDYGLYSALAGVLLFLNSIHSSVIAYPLSVKGAVADRENLRRLAGASVGLTAGTALTLGLPLVGATVIAGRATLGFWALGALFAWQIHETLRRSLMAHFHYRRAVWGDMVAYLGQAGVLAAAARTGAPTVEAALGAMVLTLAAAALLQAAQAGPRSFSGAAQCAPVFWRLGRWVLVANLASAFSAQSFAWTLALFHGAGAAASYRVAANLLGAVHPVMFGLSNLIVPGAARARGEAGVHGAWRWTWKRVAGGGLLLAPYLALLLAGPEKALSVLYGASSPYLDLETEVRLLAVACLATYLAHVTGAFLAGLEQPRSAFRIHLVGALTSLAVGLPLASIHGVRGACAGFLAVSLARACAGAIEVLKQREIPLAAAG